MLWPFKRRGNEPSADEYFAAVFDGLADYVEECDRQRQADREEEEREHIREKARRRHRRRHPTSLNPTNQAH